MGRRCIDPNNPNIVYVGTQSNGLWVTKDGGTIQRQVNQLPTGTATDGSGFSEVLLAFVDPAIGLHCQRGTQTIFAESNGHGVYMSTNGGSSWASFSPAGRATVTNAAVSSTGVYLMRSRWHKSLDFCQRQMDYARHCQLTGQSIQELWPSIPQILTWWSSKGLGGSLTVSYNAGATWSGLDWNSNEVKALPTSLGWASRKSGSVGTVSGHRRPGIQSA